MFDNFTKKLAKKMGQSVQEVAQPIQNKVSTVANNKVDLWSRVLRLGVLIFLFVDGTRRVVAEPKQNDNSPNQIVINNYVDMNPRQQRPYVNEQRKGAGGKNGSYKRN